MYKLKYLFIFFLLLPVLSLGQGTGILKLTTNPGNAEVTIDGIYKGTTPGQNPLIVDLSAGTHNLKIYYKNYEEVSVKVTIPVDEVIEKEVVLKKMSGIIINPEQEEILPQSKGKLTIISEPINATIYIDDERVSETPPFTGTLGAGRHTIKAVFKIYDPIEQVVEIEKQTRVQPNKVTTVRFDVKEKLGKITVIPIYSGTETCVIYVDGSYVNETPPFTAYLEEGMHEVEAVFTIKTPIVRKVPISKKVFVNVGSNTRVEFNIEEMTGYLTINSNIKDAEIYVNDKYFGIAPVEKALIGIGKHEINVKRNGYTSFEDNVTIKSRQNSFLNARLKKLSKLSVRTMPLKGNIFVNDENMHSDNIEIDVEPFKEINITAIKELHEEWNKKIIPKEGERINLTATLEKYSGELNITNFVQNSILNLNGSDRNYNDKNNKLPIGDYLYDISKPGYFSVDGKFTIKRNQTTSINGFLERKTLSAALLRSLVLPGWGQGYQEKSVQTWLYPTLFVSSGILSYLYTSKYNESVKDYNSIREEYLNTLIPAKIEDLREKMHKKYDDAESYENMRNIFYGLTGAVYLFNILDIYILPPGWKSKINISSTVKENKVYGGLNFYLD